VNPQDGYMRCIVEQLADDAATAKARRGRAHGDALDGDMTIEALPTVYRGTTFRSALEASWAATLDSLGIAWDYEPETVALPSGKRYLPDFHLPEIGAWLEVKGPGVPRVEKAYEFQQMLACDCPRTRGIQRCSCRWPGGELVVIGKPPRPLDPWGDDEYDHWHHWAKVRLARHHGGHPRWASTRGRKLWLTRCPRCRKATWFDSPYCRACRTPLIGAHGSSSGDPEFGFQRISGPAADATEKEGLAS
jgi:hypothetical protein